jgi:phosphatidylcholine synthase
VGLLGLVVVLTAAMFFPLKFVHPVRTARWRAVSLTVAVLWTGGIAWAAWTDFASNPVLTLLIGCHVSPTSWPQGSAQQIWPGRSDPRA